MTEEKTNVLENIDFKKLFGKVWAKKITIILFSVLVTSSVVLYSLSLPNQYSSMIVFEKKGQSGAKGNNAKLSSLAGLAGISLNTSSNRNLFEKMRLILGDYEFNKKIVEKYKINELLSSSDFDKEYVFFKNIRIFYETFKREKYKDISIKMSVKKIRKIISLVKNNESGFFFLRVNHPNREFAKFIVDIYLKELALEIKSRDLESVERELAFYSQELRKANSIELRNQLTINISDLLKKKTLANVNELYLFEVIVPSRESFIEEKTAPRRTKIIIAALLFSLVVSIAFVIAKDLISNNRD